MMKSLRVRGRVLSRVVLLALASVSLAGCVVEPCCYRPFHPYYWR